MDDTKDDIISNLDSSKILFLGNFPPCECGIATFTRDLVNAMNKRFNPRLKSGVVALNDESTLYNYNNRVVMEINRENITDFIEKAKKINNSKDIKLVCIQHEFGIFGGEYGSYLLPFLEAINKPVVVTFHSVLPIPDEKRKRIVKFICEKSSAVVVMAEMAREILVKDYGVDEGKIYIVHHGIPSAPFRPSKNYKSKVKLQDKIVLSTFGLLSKGKGIEYAIRALPKLLKKYPNLLYLVIGETHPKVRKREGESYRNKLLKEVKKFGLKEHVKFYNKYLPLSEIVSYLQATDIYLCTNLDYNQISSGTLSYALGCGKAIVSTPIAYSKEVLKNERGVLVELKSPSSYYAAIDKILSDKEFKMRLERNAYAFSRKMIWASVASKYLEIFNHVVRLREETIEKYPTIKLTHLKKMTDDFGCVQFSKNNSPDKNSGYTIDDNSRALIVSILHNNLFNSKISQNLNAAYLKFIEQAQDALGNFKNNFRNENEKLNPYSEDAFSRTLWALGYTLYKGRDGQSKEKARAIFNKALPNLEKINSPRAKAFAAIGLYYCYKSSDEEKFKRELKKIADFLVSLYEINSSENWNWFEDKLTYSNSSLSEALFLAYDVLREERYLKIAEKTLEFLSNIVFINNQLYPIGESGWCKRSGGRAFFDQQPIDAAAMVQTYIIAYNITKKKNYRKKAIVSFNWFLGKNHLGQMMYDETTGGCYDGLANHEVNLNQGAESTIAYLNSRLMLEELKKAEMNLSAASCGAPKENNLTIS